MNWKLTLIVFIPVPIIVCMFKFMLPKLWRSYNRQWRRSHSLNVMLGDSLGGVRVVKAFAKEAEETNRFYMYSTKLYEANLKTNLISLSIFPVISLLIGMSSQAIWGFGGLEVMGDSMTYGELTAYLGYIGMIFAPLNFFTSFTNIMTDTMNSAVRMFETLDQIPEITDAPDAVEIKEFKGHIKFDQVCFHYNPNRPIVKSVSFEIQPGDHVGIVGHTGSGKSTVANLITRMYDVISGSVEIDGHNVKNIKTDSLRKGIAIVSQEIFLFRGTIADNIRYARPDASMEDVIAAARAANAHDFIMKLPEGYETMVGIGSRSLSGGERQRISIARALLLSPSILILDEATAAMDTETERQISEAIEKLIVGRTTISIAHRLSTLKDCNYLMAIENGEVAEIGTAEELMAKKGCYYKLYTLQNEQMKKVMQGL
jgi:ATP-binding cassette subfamily B protein